MPLIFGDNAQGIDVIGFVSRLSTLSPSALDEFNKRSDSEAINDYLSINDVRRRAERRN